MKQSNKRKNSPKTRPEMASSSSNISSVVDSPSDDDFEDASPKVPRVNSKSKLAPQRNRSRKIKRACNRDASPQPSTSREGIETSLNDYGELQSSVKKGKKGKKGSKSQQKSVVVDKNGNEKLPEFQMPIVSRKVSPNLNFISSFFTFSSRGSPSCDLERKSRCAIIDQVSQFRIFKSVTPFDRRVTALAWHPKESTLCAVGSKGGDMLLWNYVKDEFQSLLTGIGPGGSIQCMKFDTENENRIYTCSIDGTFASKDFGGHQNNVFLDTNDWNKWYTSFDVSIHGGTLMVGDNNGFVTLLTKEGEKVWRARLHGNKVTNIQFSPREPWQVITTSVDNTVKVWDIRTLSNVEVTETSPKSVDSRKNLWLHSLVHEKPVNSAYFSALDGTRLLTTDQHSQLRVYRSPFWTLETSISHPHRQFQHLTPIRGTWHPLVDIAVAGRYPDEKQADYVPGELRTIDFFDADSGKILYQLHEPGFNKICSLNQFSPNGDALLSGSGQSILIWKQKPVDETTSIYLSKKSNVENLTVEEWPGYKKPSPRSGKSKKLKNV